MPRDERGHLLQVYLSVDRAGARTPLCPGQPLVGANALWVSVELDTASYVRMVFVTPDGETGELMRQDDAELTRQAVFRAPQELIHHAFGEAQLFIAASRIPLHEADPTIGSLFDLIHDTGILVERDGTLRPPPTNSRPAVQQLHLAADTQTLHADFDERGVAMLTVSLRADP
jgi:hypothetical protein